MKLPESTKDFEKLMKNVDFTRVMQIMIPILQPVIIGGLWLGLSKIDKRASALSALITIAEPIPTMDLNLPPAVVLASMYHSVDELADIIEEVIQALRDLDLPTAEEIVDRVKEEIAPEKINPQEFNRDIQSCLKAYEKNTPGYLKNNLTKGLYIQTCMVRKGFAQDVVKDWIARQITG